MRTEIISTHAEFLRLEASWNDLYQADPEAHFFLSWEWLERVFSNYKTDWFIIAVKMDTRAADYIAFLPLSMKSRFSNSQNLVVNEIRVAGRYTWSDYTGLICHPDYPEQAIPLLADKIKQMHWCRFYFKNLRISDQRLDIFTKQFDKDIFFKRYLLQTGRTDNVNRLLCPYVDLPDDFESYLREKLSSNTRQKVRRFMRKVEYSGTLKITHSTADTYGPHLDILTGFWVKKWSKRHGERIERYAKKYRKILEFALQTDSLFLPVLWDGDKPVGALGIFIDRQNKELLYFIAGRDQGYTKFPVGLVLHAHSIKWAISNGFKRYDFLRGDEPFKYSFGCTNRQNRYLLISTQSGTNLHQTLDPDFIYQALEIAHRCIEKKKYAKAQKSFQQILELEPDNIIAHYNLGKILFIQKKSEQATLRFENVLKLEAGDSRSEKKIQHKARRYLSRLRAFSSTTSELPR